MNGNGERDELHAVIIFYGHAPDMSGAGPTKAKLDAQRCPKTQLAQLPFLFLLSDSHRLEWGGAGMLLQCASLAPKKVALPDSSDSRDRTRAPGLMVFEFYTWPSSGQPWRPGRHRLTILQKFSMEVFTLLFGDAVGGSTVLPFLIAPLQSGRHIDDGEIDLSIDWKVAEAVASLTISREIASSVADHDTASKPADVDGGDTIKCIRSTQTLFEMAAEASGSANHCTHESNIWLERKIIENIDYGLLAVASYSLRPYCIRRAWPNRRAIDETLVPRTKKTKPAAEVGSLVIFLRDRYGLDAVDENQCVLEATNGVCIRPMVPTSCRPPRLADHLCEDHAADISSVICDSILGSVGEEQPKPHKDEATASPQITTMSPSGDTEPGPIRLLPQFLFLHPLPCHLFDGCRLLPVISRKMSRLQQIASLRRSLQLMLSDEAISKQAVQVVSLREHQGGRPFQTVSLASNNGCRAALRIERSLAAQLRVSHAAMGEESAIFRHAESLAEVDWVLEVATTASGACEPYDYSRLAWLGDAALLFITVLQALTSSHASEAQLDTAALKQWVGSLISNKALNSAASEAPLELHRYLVFAPLSSSEKVIAAKSMAAPEHNNSDHVHSVGSCKKILADSLEALLGGIVLLGSLRPAFLFLSSLSWWRESVTGSHVLNGHKISLQGDLRCIESKQLHFQKHEMALGYELNDLCCRARWLGYSALQFHATAWLISRYPELDCQGLNARKRALLSPEGIAAALPEELINELEPLLGTFSSLWSVRDGDASTSSPSAYSEYLVGLACLSLAGCSSASYIVRASTCACIDLSKLWGILERGWECTLQVDTVHTLERCDGYTAAPAK